MIEEVNWFNSTEYSCTLVGLSHNKLQHNMNILYSITCRTFYFKCKIITFHTNLYNILFLLTTRVMFGLRYYCRRPYVVRQVYRQTRTLFMRTVNCNYDTASAYANIILVLIFHVISIIPVVVTMYTSSLWILVQYCNVLFLIEFKKSFVIFRSRILKLA